MLDLELQELIMRLMVVALIIAFGLILGIIVGKQRRSEKALKESEEKYRSLFENMTDSFAFHKIVVNKKGEPIDYIFLEVNDAFERQTGLKRSEIIGKKVTKVIPGIKKSKPDLFKIYGQVALAHKSKKIEIYFTPLKRWYTIYAFCPKKDYFATIFNDITERKESEKELGVAKQVAESRITELEEARKAVLNVLEDVRVEQEKTEDEKEKVEVLLESIADGVLGIGMDERIIIFNKEAEKMLGMPAKKALGMKYDEVINFYGKDKKKKSLEFIHDALVEKVQVQIPKNSILISQDKSEIDIDSVASPIESQTGKVSGVVVVFRDVSEQRTIERMKTEFVSVASHQLRTPLSGVKWFLEMLISGDAGKLTDQQLEFVQEAFDSNDRMINLVNDLLNVSRLETGKIIPEMQKTDVAKLMKDMIKERAMIIKARNCDIQFKKDKGSFKIETDPSLYRQIFGNLLDNAIKYSDKTACGVSVKLDKQGRDKIKLTVQDNGIGIPTDKQYLIFSKFFRAENATRMETEGSGLGLYICQLIVENFGGKIWFKSPIRPRAKQKGTAFYVVLPTK